MKDANQRPESADEFKKVFADYLSGVPKEPTADDHRLGAAPSHVCHGRDDFIRGEVDAIQRNLGSPNRARLYHGPGGIGKSTVAQVIARHTEIAALFGTERYYAKLDGVTSADGVAGAVADAFQLTGADRLQRLDSLLRASVNRLLLLDTVDDPMISAEGDVEPLLQRWGRLPSITLLMTTRPHHAFVIPVLQDSVASPRTDEAWFTKQPITKLSTAAIGEMFHVQTGRRFVHDPNLESVLDKIDGMPLAAKLVGVFAKKCTTLIEVLEAWVKHSPRIFNQNVTERSLSIVVSIAMSLDRAELQESEPAQRLLRLLAELPDGCLASELPEILPDDSAEAQRVLRSVGGLAEEIDGRWTMLAPIREELRTKLELNTDDWHRTICIAANWLAENGMKYGQGIIEPLARFRADQRNFSQLLDAGLAAEIVETVGGSYGFSLFGERLGIDSETLLRLAIQLGQATDKPHETGLCWGQIADIHKQRDQTSEALRIHCEEIIPLCERDSNIKGKAVTMGKIAELLLQLGKTDEALRIYLEEELPVYERLGDVRAKAVTMASIADILEQRGQTDKALRIFREVCIPVYERLGDVKSKAVTMGKIADILLPRGEIHEAIRMYREALLVLEMFGDLRWQVTCRFHLGTALLMKGYKKDIPIAREHLIWARDTAEKHQYAEAAELREIVTRRFGGSV